MNPNALDRHDQLEQDWQRRPLIKPRSSEKSDKKETSTNPPMLSPLPDPEVVSR